VAGVNATARHGLLKAVGKVKRRRSNAKTLIDILRDRAGRQPDRDAYIFLSEMGSETHKLTYAALDARARAIGAFLQANGQPGMRVLLFYPPGLEYISAFMGCLYAGFVAVPLYPPRPNQKLDRIGKVVRNCEARFALTLSEMAPLVGQFLNPKGSPHGIQVHASDRMTEADGWQMPNVDGPDLAFLQYTSGSTGTPKGVMVSHRNLMANQAAIQAGFGTVPEDICLSWLPFYHDMGLIGTVLHALYRGFTSILMPSLDFIRDPVGWLELMSRHRATISGSPNFGYELCVHRIDAQRLAGLNLESWRIAFNGAEPVRAETLHYFAKTFAPAGFSPTVFKPCYGMAEATLFITTDLPGEAPPVLWLSRRQLEANRVEEAEADEPNLKVVSNGVTVEGHRLKIVDPETRKALAEGEVGEIWFRGPSVAEGYWGREVESERTFQAVIEGGGPEPYLRTGDLGFLHQGRLYVTGRLKDLIIIRGRNYYPQDLELTASTSHRSLRINGCVAFSVPGELGEETLVIVGEVARQSLRDLDPAATISAMRQAISEQHQVQAHTIVLVKPGSIPKTSSGKVQRSASRELLSNNAFDILGASTRDEDAEAIASQPKLDRDRLMGSQDRQEVLVDWMIRQVAHILKIDPAGIAPQAPLTSLGLDSIMAIDLEHRLATQLGLALSMTAVLDGKNFHQLAELALAAEEVPEAPDLEAPGDEFPLSHNQAALWFLNRWAPESDAYNIAFCVAVRGGLNVVRLTESLRALAKRHPSLRTTFHVRGGQPFQRVHDVLEPEVNFLDINGWEKARVDAFLESFAARPFALENGPLLRLCILERADGCHLLALVIHHIIADFWSILTLMADLERQYLMPRSNIAPPAAQYSHFVNRQRAFMESDRGEAQWRFWREQLAGELPVMALPTDRTRPAVQSYHGAAHHFAIDPQLSQSLRELSRDENTTLYTVLLAAFQVMLGRYTDGRDLVIGSPAAGRTAAAWRDVIGYFVNPIALRGRLHPGATFREHLAAAKTMVQQALAHSDFPFESLVARLQPERDPSRPPICQVMFVLQQPHVLEDAARFALQDPAAKIRFAGLDFGAYPLQRRVTAFDLTLMVVDSKTGLTANLEYNSDLFDATTAARMARHFVTLLKGIVAAPDTRLKALPMSGEQERMRLLEDWRGRASELPREGRFHRIFEALAAQSPDAPAVEYGGESLTYSELNRKANQLARGLRENQVVSGSLVGICANRSIASITAMLGVMKAGGAFLPIDPAYPEERLRFVLEDSGVAVILTGDGISLPPTRAKVIAVERLLDGGEEGNLGETCCQEDLAYVIYTSGSTGRPKGVQLAHIGLANLTRTQCAHLGLGPGKKVAQFASPSFDASVWEFVMALGTGACLCLVPPETLGEALAGFFDDKKITHALMTPSLMASLPERRFAAMEVVIAGGEACPANLVGRHGERFFNAYGPTEGTVCATIEACDPSRGCVTIGRPLTNVSTYVLDREGQPCAEGVPGELAIGGVGLARGYLNRPSLTAEKFVPNPFSNQEGRRLYRTGDLCRFDNEGNLRFLGRIDHQVKLRGYRIELGEIEAVLAACDQVAQAVALVRNDRIVAYLVPEPNADAEFAPAAIRRRLEERLPAYMVPSALVPLEKLPVTPNGKLDRKALPEPRDLTKTEENRPPETALQQTLAGIWADVLKVPSVGLNDHFFQLGGHSLIATQVTSRIREAMNLDVGLKTLFLNPSLEDFAEAVARQEATCTQTQWPPIEHVDDDAPPLSFTQERLWFLDQLEGPTAIYNMPA